MVGQRGRRATLEVERCSEVDAEVEALLGEPGRPGEERWVVRSGGMAVGAAVYVVIGPDAELRALAIEAGQRFRGIGRRLVVAVAAAARAAGCRRLRVRGPLEHEAAGGFFRAVGFEQRSLAFDLAL